MLEDEETTDQRQSSELLQRTGELAGRPGLAGGGFYHLVQSSEIV